MALQLQLENGSLIGGGGAAFRGANVYAKPLDHGTLGHYRVVVVAPLVASQAATSRLFELRNSASTLIVPTLIEVELVAIGDVAPDQLMWISMYSCTAFSAVDTISASTPAAMVVRPTGMTAAPGGAVIRQVTLAGASGGMTGWTATKDTGVHSHLLAWMSSASAERPPRVKRFVDPADLQTHPPVYGQNQGFVIENTTAGSAQENNVSVVITVAWAEVPVGGF